MMPAADPDHFGSSDANEYLSLFQRYIVRSLEALNTRIAAELEELSTESREQAWHILDYALKLTHGWEAVRTLLLALAPRMERAGLRHEWLPYLERGIACSRRVQDHSGEAQLSLYIGRLYRLRGEFGEATAWFEKSAALCQALDDPHGQALALNQLGYVARLQGQFAEANRYVNRALALLEAGDPERATSFSWLAAIAYDQMNWALAEEHFRTAYSIWQEAGDQQRATWSLQNLGDTLRNAGRYAEAATNIQQAILLLGQMHDPVNQAIARMNLGIVHLLQEEYEEAIALFALAEGVFRQAQDQLQLAKVSHNRAMAERALGHYALAETNCQRSIALCENLGEIKLMVNSLDELGLTYQGTGRFAEAIATYESGLRHLASLDPDPFRDMLEEMLQQHLAEARNVGGCLKIQASPMRFD